MKKWLKWTIYSVTGVFILLVATLAIHIAMVTPSGTPKNQTANWQLGKIDFASSLDSAQYKEAKKAIWQINGIKQAVIGTDRDNLVFAYTNNGDLTHEKVYENFSKNISFESSLFTPSADQMAASCPVIDKSSITYRLGNYFQDLFASN